MSATLNAQNRDKLGSRPARYLRLQGRVPCSIQGEGKDNRSVSLDEAEFLAARRHHEHLFDLDFGGGDLETAIIRELQWNAMGDRIDHVEFRRVIRGQATEADVELEFSGHPKGGLLNHLVTHLTISAIPSLIPDVIEVPVDHMEEGTPLLAGDIALPEGVSLVVEAKLQVANVVTAKAEVAETDEDEEEGGDLGFEVATPPETE